MCLYWDCGKMNGCVLVICQISSLKSEVHKCTTELTCRKRRPLDR